MSFSQSTPLHGATSASLPALLNAWNRHQDLRSANATIPELAASRSVLDRVRAAR